MVELRQVEGARPAYGSKARRVVRAWFIGL